VIHPSPPAAVSSPAAGGVLHSVGVAVEQRESAPEPTGTAASSLGPMSPPPSSVVAVGLVTLDVVHVVDRLLAPDEKVVGRSQRLEVGGPAANAARVAAALGSPTRLVAPHGRSPVRRALAEQLAADGVRWTDPARDSTHPAPVSSVLVDAATGSRAVISGGGPAAAAATSLSPAVIRRVLDEAAVLLVDGHELDVAVPIAAEAGRRGIPVLLDAGSHKPGLERLLPHVDLAIASADFRPPDGTETLAWLLAHGIPYAARSAGPDPLAVRVAAPGRGRAAYRIVVPHVRVVDTLGAGDVLHGAAAHAIARLGLSRSTLPRILRDAARLAAHSCRHPGVLGWRDRTTRPIQP